MPVSVQSANRNGQYVYEKPPSHPSMTRRSRSLSRTYEALDSPASHSSSLYSLETVDSYRKTAKGSHNPLVLFKFSLYLLDLADGLTQQEDDNENSNMLTHASVQPASLKSYKEKDPKKKAANSAQSLQAEALKYLKKLAYSSVGLGKAPLPEAQFFLGDCLSEGKFGLSVDHDRAFNLYLQASKQNHPESTFKAAFGYENGTGTKQDAMRSVQFYRKAASLGDPHAMHRLALILQYGQLGEAKNPREAMTWLKRAAHIAADSGYPRPIHDLAMCFEKTGGSPAVIPDERYALELYSKAATLGFAPSQYRIGLCYEHGHLGCPKNAEASIAWYSKAAEQNHPEAQLALSGWYLTGATGILRQNEVEAFLWAEKSAKQGNPKALFAMGHYYETGTGTAISLKSALDSYHKASLQGNKRAAKRLKELKKLIRSGKLPCPSGYKLDSSLCSLM